MKKDKPFFPFHNIIVPVLLNCNSEPAIDTAIMMAEKNEITFIGVVTIPLDKSLSEGAIPARRLRAKIKKMAGATNNQSRTRVIVSYNPWEELDDIIRKENYDLMIMSWRQTFDAMHVTTEKVLSAPPCDLLLIYKPLAKKPERILTALRGGPNAELALSASIAISQSQQSKITSLHLFPKKREVLPSARRPESTDSPFRGLSRVLASMPEIDQRIIETNNARQEILEASRHYDLLIIGATSQLIYSDDSLGPITDNLSHEDNLGVLVTAAKQPMLSEKADEMAGKKAISILVDKWFAENTYHTNEFTDLKHLLHLKEEQNVTISLALPALNEEDTVGNVIKVVKTALMDDYPILDEIILMDSNSTDRTREIAMELGIPVFIHQQVLPQYDARRGKGEALWKSLFCTKGDIIVWIDTDIINIQPHFVYGILGPMLANPYINYVKGFYRRPIKVGEKLQAGGGGRVTELTARPLLNLFYPELSGLVQPLSGEYGGRRSLLENLVFYSGYGVETGLLIDIFEKFGLDIIAQVDLKERIHHNQSLGALSKMSFAIIQTVIQKLEQRYGVNFLEDVNKTMKLIRQAEDRLYLEVEEIAELNRPPMSSLPEYRALFPESDRSFIDSSIESIL